VTSTIRSGRHLDQLAELEEERRFLLRSLKDLEREFEAGDVDADDYQTLKDGYTVRAAAVLRQIEEGRRKLAPKRPRRRGVVAAVVLTVLLGGAGVGMILAQAWGERGTGQEITGFTPGDDVRAVLVSARAALNEGNLPAANELFFRVVQAEQERGVDNPEALAYYGWTLALGTRANPNPDETGAQLELALLALDRALEMDENYADPACFVAIIEANFRNDPVRALPFLEQCEQNDPPRSMVTLIEAFADEIRAAADES
jgi:tetratricopeptide (TPR) repeat protein